MYSFILPFRFIVVSPRSALLRHYTATVAWPDRPANISPENTHELHISCAIAPLEVCIRHISLNDLIVRKPWFSGSGAFPGRMEIITSKPEKHC